MPKAGAEAKKRGRPAAECPPGDHLAAPPPSIWERLDAMGRNPKTTLTHAQIAEAAVGLADAEGLAAVSMRRLAEHLGVSTMALYRYVANKDELLELMIDAVGDRPWPEMPTTWREMFRENARRRRTQTLAHPWLVEALALIPNPITPAGMAAVDRALDVLAGLDLDADSQMLLLRTVDAYTKGAVASEVNQRLLLERRGLGADGDIRLLLRSNIHWLLGSGRFPHFAEVVRGGLRPPDPAGDFEVGLECLLDGLAARLGI
jgi:AcrR family transcriptional regulator